MKPIFVVIKHEIVTTLSKRSFWLTTFLLPLFVIVMSLGSQVMSARIEADSGDSNLLSGESGSYGLIGYVDAAGLIQTLPPAFPVQLLQQYPDPDAAQAALEDGTLARYYVIPADYLAQGQVVVVEQEYSPFSRFAGIDVMQVLLDYNLSQVADTPGLLANPMPVLHSESVRPAEPGGDTTPAMNENATFLVTYGTLMIFYFILAMSSGFMLQSVAKEKENRMAEVLLVSLRPRELMLGKLVGLGAVALLQMFIWLGGSVFALDRGKQLVEMAQSIVLPPGFMAWGLAYLLFGYLVYASLLAAVGALAPTAREGSQFTFIAMVPLMIPLFFISVFIESPNGGTATFFSLFPLTAPVSMMTRLVATDVPTWQPVVGLALLVLTAYGFVLLAGRFFRADTLLSDASLDWRRFLAEFRKR